jgi:YEATS domain-containing protein 4
LKAHINSVTFLLHESFQSPIRKIYEEPFLLTETGWGEFNIKIQIEFTELYQNQVIQFEHFLEVR